VPPAVLVVVVLVPPAPTVTVSVPPDVKPVIHLMATPAAPPPPAPKSTLAELPVEPPAAPPPTTVTLTAVTPAGTVNVPDDVKTSALGPDSPALIPVRAAPLIAGKAPVSY